MVKRFCVRQDGAGLAALVRTIRYHVESAIEDGLGTTKAQEQILMGLENSADELVSIFEIGYDRDPMPREEERG